MLTSFVVILAVTLGTSEEPFGRAGQIVPDGAVELAVAKAPSPSYTVDFGTFSPQIEYRWRYSTTAAVSPGVLLFVTDQLAVGVNLLARREPLADGGNVLSIGLGLRCAINLPFGDRLSLFPTVAAAYDYSRRHHPAFKIEGMPSVPVIRGSTTVGHEVLVDAYLPLLFHLSAHLFLGAGPAVAVDLLGADADAEEDALAGSVGPRFAFRSVVGGWF